MHFTNKEFEAYIGEDTYYFLVNVVYRGKDQFIVATFDGTDYFWAHYFFLPAQGHVALPGSRNRWMGFAEVGPGSFPKDTPVSVQCLWFALFSAGHTNDFPFPQDGHCSFETNWLTAGNPAYSGAYSARLSLGSSSGTPFFESAKFYAPDHLTWKNGTTEKIPTLSGPWLSSEIEVLESTNLSGQVIPLRFALTDYVPLARTDKPSDYNTVMKTREFEFQVQNWSTASALPSVFPPVYSGKTLAVTDYRNKVVKRYIVGGMDDIPGNAAFVSRGTRQYWQLPTEWAGTHVRVTQKMSHAFIYIFSAFFILGSAALFYFIYKRRQFS